MQNRTNESAIQPTTASTIHLTTRPALIRRRGAVAAGPCAAQPGQRRVAVAAAAEQAGARAVDLVLGGRLGVCHAPGRVTIMAAGCVIGVDLGGTKLLAGTVDADLQVHHRTFRMARPDDASAVIDQLVETVEEGRAAAPGEVLGVGLGVPGLVDPETGVVADSNHLPLAGVALRDVLAERVGLPVAIDNDGNMAMLAESRRGAARGARDAVLLTIGTGIGGGLLVGGEHRPRRARRGGRARAHDRRRGRAAVPGALPEPRVPGGARLGPRAGDRGRAPGRRAPRQRAAPRRASGATTSPGCW